MKTRRNTNIELILAITRISILFSLNYLHVCNVFRELSIPNAKGEAQTIFFLFSVGLQFVATNK